MARTCVFCGKGPVTAEHVWPDWIVRRFPRTRIRVGRTGDPATSYTKKSIALTVRAVCEGCNSGWMSDIENEAKRLLVEMIDGRPTTLDSAAQRTVSVWALKTVMVFELTLGGAPASRFWRSEERAAFATGPHPPPGDTVVTVASYLGSLMAYFFGGDTGVVSITGDGPRIPGTRATLVIGRLVLQVESNRWKEVTGREGWAWPTPHSDQAEWISPQQHPVVVWPTAAPLNDASLKMFSGETQRRA